MLKSDETLDFHNKLIAEVALGQKCKNAKRSQAYILTSPLGHIYTNACPDGLHCVKLYGDTSYNNINWDDEVDFIRASTLVASNKHANDLKKWLKTYFKNPLHCKDLEVSFCGLEEYGKFNSKVWMTIFDTCPPGELMSYRELAERSGYGSGASKVVGYAINKNPYLLVVGDHRVVKATGEIWCENESQRNKLRRILAYFEASFTGESLDDMLLRVKDRNNASKKPRASSDGTKVKKETTKSRAKKVKKEPGTEKIKKSKQSRAKKGKKVKKEESEDDSDLDDDDDDDDYMEDDD